MHHRLLLLIIAVAGLVRAIAVALDVKPLYLAGLRLTQTEMANNILDHGRWFVILQHGHYVPQIREMPGLAIVDVAVWSAVGQRTYSVITGLQVLIDLGMVLLVYWIALRLFDRRRVALLAAGLYAIWPGAAVLAKTPSLDTWASYLLIASVAAFVLLQKRPDSIARQVLFGTLIGIGVYFRPFLIILPILLALVGISGGWRRKLTAGMVPTLVALLLLTPWTVRNAYEFHAFIPTRTGFGQALWEGLGQRTNSFGAVDDDGAAKRLVQKSRPDLVSGTPAFDNFLRDKARNAIAAHPGFYLGLVARRCIYLLPCLLVLLWWRRWPRERLLLAVIAAATIVPYILIRIETRFWVPAVFAYFILAAAVTELLLEAFSDKRAT
jgi:4-amino-4-deoxy-L-arabinose transferase-like glycosyltransferase